MFISLLHQFVAINNMRNIKKILLDILEVIYLLVSYVYIY